jgi:LmbE family N-acetylglucosaminyl deacetylase
MINHLYLSPHLDDAILSCGGLIRCQRMNGELVTVVTLCAGTPDYAQLSPFAQQYHAAWGDLPDLLASRRAEDEAVLSRWGATAYHLNTLDSIYRRTDGKHAYPDIEALFAEPCPQDAADLPARWQQELKHLLPMSSDTIVYAPLAAGDHVDHQLVRTLALALLRDGREVWFYEDYPHAEKPESLSKARSWFGPVTWQSRTIPIEVDSKIAAICGYQTQWPFIFGNEHGAIRRVKRFTAETARDISPAERLRYTLVGVDGRRERLWRAILGYHAHAERIWRFV